MFGSAHLPEIPGWIDAGGLVALLAGIVWGSLRGWWVARWVHEREITTRDDTIKRLVSERNRYLDIALRATRASELSTNSLVEEKQLRLEEVTRAAVEAAMAASERKGI